jgi:hypothetical protein
MTNAKPRDTGSVGNGEDGWSCHGYDDHEQSHSVSLHAVTSTRLPLAMRSIRWKDRTGNAGHPIVIIARSHRRLRMIRALIELFEKVGPAFFEELGQYRAIADLEQSSLISKATAASCAA